MSTVRVPNMSKRKQHASGTSHSSPCSPKRVKTQCLGISASCPSSTQIHTPAYALTEGSLRDLQRPTVKTKTSLIRDWRSSVSVENAKSMEAPPTPRSAGLNDRGRRQLKHNVRSQRRRTPSPSERPTPQTYRTRNMHHAKVFVDTSIELPPTVGKKVQHILGTNTLEDQVVAMTGIPQHSVRVAEVAGKYWDESRRNARECSLEGDWKASLYGLVRSISDIWSDEIKAHMSEKLWNSDLKPTGPSLELSANEDRTSTSDHHTPQNTLEVRSLEAAASDTTFVGSIPSLPPPSIAPTTSTEAADPYHISTPKPDITIGLAHGSFVQKHQQLLVNHQASGSILNDPHAADMGIRFPFLIAEVKGLSLNGSMVSAQNQAAISGASMITILQDLLCQVGWCQSPVAASASTSHSDDTLCFSVVTAGPLHELWVHYVVERAYYMECLQLFRTTLKRDALQLTHCVHRILNWGRSTFKDDILGNLDRI